MAADIAGKLNKVSAAGATAFNAVGAASSVLGSVRSLFGGDSAETTDTNVSAVNRLRSFLSKNDILSNNLFYVSIGPPAGKVTPSNISRQDLALLCQSASLPGVSFATSDVRRYGVGTTEKYPTFPIFTDLSLTFIGDGKGLVRNFFYTWMNNIVRFTESGGSRTDSNGFAPFAVNYKKDYACDLKIVVLNRASQKIIVCDVTGAYPIALGDQSLSWQDIDSLMTVPVTFTYYKWKTEEISVSGLLGGSEPSLSLLGKVVKIGTALQTLATVRKPRSIGDIVNVTKNATSAINGIKGTF